MSEKAWPAVVGTGLITVAVLLIGGAAVYLGASSLSVGADDREAGPLLLLFVLPLIAAAASIGGSMTLLSRARPTQWGRYVGLGVAIAVALVLFFLFVVPQLLGPEG